MAQTWTISDKNYVMLAQFTNEDSNFISNDEHFISVDTPSSYYQFDCLISNELAEHIVVGNHVILRDKEGFIHDFTIRKITTDINNVRMTVYAENGGMDLNNESAQPFTAPSEQKPLEWYLTQSGQPLYDSPIKLGLNELSDLKRVISNDSKETKLLQRLITTVNAFDGGEYRLHAKLANNNTTLPVLNLQLDIVKKLGSDISQTFLIDDHNLKELTNETSIVDLITAVFPRGKELDNGTTVDISSIVYDDGTYYTTKGDPYIKNRLAHREWSYSRFSNDERWGYILGNFEYDTESPQELFNRALTYLKQHDTPTVAFSASGRDMNAKLGDTIMIATHKTPEPIYLKARVLQMKVSYVDNDKTEYILGNYAIQPSMVSQELLNLRNQIQDSKSNYVWLRYADDREGNGISENPEGKAYLGVAYNMPSPIPSNDPSDYTWSLIKGSNGINGANGVGVQTSNVQYALGDSGTTAPTTAWTTTIPTLQDNKYLWTRTIIYYTNGTNTVSYSVSKKGDRGEQGIRGAKGEDGRSLYTWLKYANDANGNGMSETPEGKKYIGLAYNKTTPTESSNPNDYTWSLIQGENGVKGADGKTYYTWVKYADTATGGGLSDNPTGKKYIGLAYNKTTPTESTNPSDYTWALIKGDKGDKGDTGNGIATTTISYGVSSSGTTAPTSWGSTIPTVSPSNYLWTRTVITYTDNATTTSYSVGKMGEQGVKGDKGDTGATLYTWVKYADNASGSGMSDYPSGKKYIGLAYNKPTANESTTASDYQWALIQGEQGIQGAKGDTGETLYTWIKYADTATGTGMSDNPTGKTYIGLAYNKSTARESTNPSDYTWSLIKGDKGDKGPTGATGNGISSTNVSYGVSSSGTTPPTSWGSTVPTVSSGQFLWTRTIIYYTNGTNSTSYSIGKMGEQGAQGAKGDKGDKGPTGATGATGNGISSTNITYGVSTSGTTAPTSWSSSVPTVSSGQFLWTRTIIMYTNNTTSTAYSVGKMGEKGPTGATGAKGDKGDKGNTGATGNGVSSTVVSYGVSSSGTTQPTSWGTSIPSVPNGQFLWTRTVMNYTNGSSTTFYSIAKMGETGARGSMGIAYLQPTAPTGTIENGSTWFKTVSSTDRRITSVYHYLSGTWVQNQFTQDAINVKNLSALSATLGNVTAGTITGSTFTSDFDKQITSGLRQQGSLVVGNGKIRTDYTKYFYGRAVKGNYIEYNENSIKMLDKNAANIGETMELTANYIALQGEFATFKGSGNSLTIARTVNNRNAMTLTPDYILGSDSAYPRNYQQFKWTSDGFELRPVNADTSYRSGNSGVEIAGNTSYVDFKVPYNSTVDFNSRIALHSNQEFEITHNVPNRVMRLKNSATGGETHVVSQYSNVGLMCNYGVNVRNPYNSGWKGISASSFSQQSDEKWKYNIKDMPSRLEQFKNLDFKSYRLWTENGKYQEGIIANDNIELPFISKGYDGYSVDTYAYTTFVGKATQEYIVQTDNTINELKNENAEIKAENAEIKAENAEIKAENAELKIKVDHLTTELETIKQQLSTLLNK